MIQFYDVMLYIKKNNVSLSIVHSKMYSTTIAHKIDHHLIHVVVNASVIRACLIQKRDKISKLDIVIIFSQRSLTQFNTDYYYNIL